MAILVDAENSWGGGKRLLPVISSFQCHIPGPAQHIQPGDYPGHVLLP